MGHQARSPLPKLNIKVDGRKQGEGLEKVSNGSHSAHFARGLEAEKGEGGNDKPGAKRVLKTLSAENKRESQHKKK